MLTDKMLKLVDTKLTQVRHEANQNIVVLLRLARIANDCENLLGIKINIPSKDQLKNIDGIQPGHSNPYTEMAMDFESVAAKVAKVFWESNNDLIDLESVKTQEGKIAAIKKVREVMGWGLAEAKDYIERLEYYCIERLEGKMVITLTPDDLTIMFDAQNLKRSYRDPLETSDYITTRLLLNKSKALIACAKYTITQALEDYANVLNVERNQITSSSRSQIDQLDRQLNIEKKSTKVEWALRLGSWILFGILYLLFCIALLTSTTDPLKFIIYLFIYIPFGLPFYGLFWIIPTEIVARIINSIRNNNKKFEIQESISHVSKKTKKRLISLEKREEDLKKAQQILSSYMDDLVLKPQTGGHWSAKA